jgi:hypothetical protein
VGFGDDVTTPLSALAWIWCFLMHARFGTWNESGDIVCRRCNRIAWKDAATSAQYRRMYG